jgi:predicted RNA-binding Zn ribbon-like protein
VLNKSLGEALSRSQVVRKNGGFSWELRASQGDLDQMLWPVARSALDLLVSTELDTVRECAADDCAWLFLDESRNGSRRWCDMKVCGNRSKIRRFRKRASSQRGSHNAKSVG